jgi:hypothetical protein
MFSYNLIKKYKMYNICDSQFSFKIIMKSTYLITILSVVDVEYTNKNR